MNKPLYDFLDKCDGLKEGTSFNNIEKEKEFRKNNEDQTKYLIIDYYTGKQLGEFDTEFDANHARSMHLQSCLHDNVVHNNLLLVVKK